MATQQKPFTEVPYVPPMVVEDLGLSKYITADQDGIKDSNTGEVLVPAIPSDPNVTGQNGMTYDPSSTVVTVDWAKSKVHYCIMTANTKFIFQNPEDGGRYLLIIKEGGSGGYTPTFTPTPSWVSNTTPSYITTLNSFLVISFVYVKVENKYFAIEADGFV